MASVEQREPPAFLTLSGFIDELGRVQLLPTLNSVDRPHLPVPQRRSRFKARYHHGENEVLERTVAASEIRACGPTKRTGLDYIAFQVTLPLIPGGRAVELLRDDVVILERRLTEPPEVTRVRAEIREGRLLASWALESSSIIGCATFLRFDDGRSIMLRVTHEETELSLDLVGFPDGGAGVLEVVASDGLLNGSAQSAELEIPPSPPLGIITSPVNGSVSQPRQPLSLMGNAHDAFADGIDWKRHQLLWRLDGEVVHEGSAQALVDPPDPGSHVIELVSQRWGVLDSVSTTVDPPTSQHERLDQLLASIGAPGGN